ncbi:DUF3097 family protein [Nesterenkonia alkaliphila]|uniref:DUF3097 family protein n=1 Tax=Nesterenkonia alkaliphila TaxID=1463631 RepID=A0A7K1UKV7_9MICC|nr:DUF3097 family protein [Nesterenkonia alkaliphila]MVT27127.1 DUF3097 family protein [Nesterenkonia alkaliphila]GFZ89265.1 hypothetical protein GCM10011359_18260 [Nesterenkonia alkaliphila]
MSASFPTDWSSWGAQDVTERRRRTQRTLPQVPAAVGTEVEERASGWVGVVVGVEASGGIKLVRLRDYDGTERAFPLGFGFLVEGEPVELVAPAATAKQAGPRRTASGSFASEQPIQARTARASRIWVEGTHDAELVEKVWGDDLREVGIVVEPLHGADDLATAVRMFQPGPQRRLGVLLDHLVAGSKESRIAEQTMALPGAAGNVLVLGHPYVDVWQAVKPERVGLKAWPHVPRGTDIKVGTLRALGLPAANQRDIAHGWKQILSRVRSYTDLEPSLLGRVEELIDFVTC